MKRELDKKGEKDEKKGRNKEVGNLNQPSVLYTALGEGAGQLQQQRRERRGGGGGGARARQERLHGAPQAQPV